MHDLMVMHNTTPQGMEKTATFHPAPRIHTTYNTVIEERQQNMKILAPRKGKIHIYMDGSGIENKNGAAATTKDRTGKRTSLRYQLGNVSHHTVYEAEIVGLILVTNLANKRNKLWKLILFSDNQAAIKTIQKRATCT